MITIKTLSNNVAKEGFEEEHGLSLLIDALGHRILFDCGQSDKFLTNAKAIGESLAGVESIVLSHSHYDHTWGLKRAVKTCKDATVYAGEGWDAIYPHATRKRWFRPENIGVKPWARRLKGVQVVKDCYELYPNIYLISSFRPICGPKGSGFFIKLDGKLQVDDMRHEVALAINDNGWTVITGCGHSGVDNILASFLSHFPDATIKAVIGGFHIRGGGLSGDKNAAMRERTVSYLTAMEYLERVVSGHCTGEVGMEALREALGDKVTELIAGESFTI